MPGPATIDHLVIRARDLESGSAYVADALGIDLAAGGAHPAMGTHNRVTGIGDAYLEVIAVDPEAAAPERARWFGLDELADDAPPRLHAWIARVDEPVETPETGPALTLSRGDLSWRVTVRDDGQAMVNMLVDNSMSLRYSGPTTMLRPDRKYAPPQGLEDGFLINCPGKVTFHSVELREQKTVSP